MYDIYQYVISGCIRKVWDTFQKVTIPNIKTIQATVNKLRQILEKKEPNKNAKYLVKRNWMKPEIGLNILFENPLDALYRGQGFKIISSNCHKNPEI
jgi:hypothetical protein